MVNNPDTIERFSLRWRGQAGAASYPLTQQRIATSFAALTLHPPEMPPNAVLIIRSIKGLPAINGLDKLPEAWYQELRQLITKHYQQAAHLQNGMVPASAQSVMFLDYAQALAGLTQSVIEGRFRHEWFWSQIIPGANYTDDDALVLAWTRYIPYLPAAFKQLSHAQIITSVQKLSSSAITLIIRELQTAYALPQLPRRTSANFTVDPLTDKPSRVLSADAYTPLPVNSPWQNWLTVPTQRLTPQMQYLIGLTLTLAHAPTYARSMTFAERTSQWFAYTEQQTEKRRASTEDKLQHPKIRVKPADATPTQTPAARDASNGHADSDAQPVSASISPAQNDDDDTLEAHESPSALVAQGGLWTQYGGIFYLINVMDLLLLPQAWDAHLSEHLTAWALLEALTRSLLPASLIDAQDAIWQIFAELDNRDPQARIGADFPPQSEYRLPRQLFRRYAAEQVLWRVSVTADTLRIIDDTYHYLVIEMPLGKQKTEAVVASLIDDYESDDIQIKWTYGDYQTDAALSTFAQAAIAPNLQTWLQHALGFVRYCLQDLAAINPADLLRVPARIMLTFTHIDVYLPSDAVDLQIRKTGLDRDPAWMPDFGYIILFHFDEG